MRAGKRGCSPQVDAGFLSQSLTELGMCYWAKLTVSLKHPPVSSLHLPSIGITGVLLHPAFYIGPLY